MPLGFQDELLFLLAFGMPLGALPHLLAILLSRVKYPIVAWIGEGIVILFFVLLVNPNYPPRWQIICVVLPVVSSLAIFFTTWVVFWKRRRS